MTRKPLRNKLGRLTVVPIIDLSMSISEKFLDYFLFHLLLQGR